ncbi:hypothetical protein GC088_01190 [Arthrobacter sp. JZ12]|nr:hypothetical protein GC088_01190 [Arthrobacter sp. JZ12]
MSAYGPMVGGMAMARFPTTPGQQVPQQTHLDVVVDNLDAAGETFRVFLDPAGHPSCLCLK